MVRRTRWLVLPGLLALVLLVVAGVLVVPLWSVSAGNRVVDDDPLGAEERYSTAMAGPVERWVAPYNRGVARYEQEKWDASAADFELAALLAPIEHDCMIRLNWSSALERGADALVDGDDLPGATVRYQQALLVLATSTCPDDELAPSGSSMADQQSENRERLSGKISDQPPPDDDADEPAGDPLDELAKRAEQAQQERQNAEMGDDPRSGGEGERTW